MPDQGAETYYIALVGGGDFCREVLGRYALAEGETEFSARISAVADPDPASREWFSQENLD